jgi:hypothetical protein
MIFFVGNNSTGQKYSVKYEEFRDTTSYLSRKKNIAQFRLCGKGDLFLLNIDQC